VDKLVKYVKSRTLQFAALVAVLGVLELNLGLLQEALGDWYGGVFILISAISAFLRVITTVPLEDK
jgi:hypothetical protein